MKMGKNKSGMLLLATMVVLLAAACSNNGQPAASSGQPDNGSAPEPISYAKLYRAGVFLGDSITEGLSYHDVREEENAAITLLSVTPVAAEAEKSEPRYRNIANYKEGLKKPAAEKQVGYVDLTPLVAEHSDLYDTDGIHLQEAFYPLLLDYLKDAADLRQSAK